jgi:hypothetical protein
LSQITGGDNAILQGGNSFGTATSIGSNENYPLLLKTNGQNRFGFNGSLQFYNALYGLNTFAQFLGTSTAGANISRNTPDGYSVFAFNDANSSSTGHIVDFQNQGNTRSFIGNDGSLTFDNTASANGITLFNTADQTTNYERVKQYWGSNTFNIEIGNGGTGTIRSMVISAADITLGGRFVSTGNGFSTGIATPNPGVSATALSSFTRSKASSNNYSSIGSFLTVNQSGTAGYRAFVAAVYEQALGTGPHLLMDLGLTSSEGGAFTSKFSVDNNGIVSISNIIKLAIATNSSPSDGDIWREDNTNTGLKIRVNGVTKTITLS